jgi:hypothetical protein
MFHAVLLKWVLNITVELLRQIVSGFYNFSEILWRASCSRWVA